MTQQQFVSFFLKDSQSAEAKQKRPAQSQTAEYITGNSVAPKEE